jgi:hypothetical protein
MELIFSFDSIVVNNPNTWVESNYGLEFDPINQIITINHDVTHTWVDDGFNYLYSRALNGGFCDLVNVSISYLSNGLSTELYTGVISIPQCTFNERQRTVDVTIKDDSFGAQIENNKGVKVGLDSTETKNAQPIAAIESFVFPFDPSTGTYLTDTARGYSVYDAFKFLISWMTDNRVGFESDTFDPTLTNDGSFDWLVSGIDLRSVGEVVSAPKISFQDLFDTMRKARNIQMGFERDSNNNPVVRIENRSYFITNTSTVTLPDVNETKLSFETNILYTSIKIGSEILRLEDCNDGNTNCNAFNNISYYGFETEYYSLSGECVNGIELDLTIEDPIIVDTNKVQDVAEFLSDTYDDKTFLIKRDPTQSNQAQKSDPLGLGQNWYNEDYTNKEILARYQDYLSGTLSLFNLYNGYNLFLATGNAASGSLLPLQTPTYTNYVPPLNVEVYDPYNRFDLGTDKFTPVDEGAYQFCMGIAIDDFITSASGVIVSIFLNVEHYDSGGALLQKFSSDIRTHTTRLASPIFEEWTSPWVSMDSGDYTIFTVDYAQNLNTGVAQSEISLGGSTPEKQYFQCCASRVAIQDAQVNTGNNRMLLITSFEYPLDQTTARNIINDTTQRIRVTSLGVDRTGYLNSFDYNFVTGKSSISIISNG